MSQYEIGLLSKNENAAKDNIHQSEGRLVHFTRPFSFSPEKIYLPLPPLHFGSPRYKRLYGINQN